MMEDDDYGEGPSAGPSPLSSTPLITTPGSFDLDTYVQNYSGHTKVIRLVFISERCPPIQGEALRLAIQELKKSVNTVSYKETSDKAADILGSSFRADQSWIDSVDKKSQQQLERLELELNNHKTNLQKEAIRQGHMDLGDFHYSRGDLNSALKCYVRTRDYCTTTSHILSMCLAVIKVAIEMSNYSHVANYVTKAEQTPDLSDASIHAKLRAAAGLAHLENRKYKLAAKKFLETPFEFGGASAWPEVISPQDIAIYGSLTALATLDRQELKKKVIDNAQFRNFLELTPEVRELIADFYESRYASMLRYLDQIKPGLLLDVHLWDHVNFLYDKIRSKALIQYFTPFISVDLTTMATAFNTTVVGLEKELSGLIMDGSIQARIDSHNKRLYARQADQRSVTFQNVLRMGEDYQWGTQALLQRVSMMRNELVVKPHVDKKL